MKRALVTGGSGFIGQLLCKELVRAGYEVVLFDRDRTVLEELAVRHVRGDILDISLLRDAAHGVSMIFHLAGVLGTDYLCQRAREAVQVNILGTINVLEIAKEVRAKVINTGVLPEWDNSYMITKKAAMRIGRMYRREFGVDVVTLEVSHVYGPGQRGEPYHKAIPTFVIRALKGTPLQIYGKGTKYMDCVYVTDVARALHIASEIAGLERVLSVRSNEGMTVFELARKIIELTGSTSRIEFVPMRPGEPDDDEEGNLLANTATPLPGWRPLVPFEEGLARTIDWYRKHLTIS